MNSPSVVLKNFVSSVLIRIIVPFTSFVIFIAIARLMGVESVGKYTLLTTVFLVFQFLSSMGLSPLLVRQIAQGHRSPESLYSSAMVIGLGSLLLWAPLMIAVAGIGHYSRDVFISTIVLALGLPFACLSIINAALFMGLEKFEFIPIISAVESVFLLAASFAVILKGFGMVWLAVVLASGKLLSVLIGSFFVFRKIQLSEMCFNKQLAFEILRMLPPFFLIYALGIVFYRMDVLQLSFLTTEHDLGLYATALKLYFLVMILPDSYSQALFPRLSTLAMAGSIQDISLRSIKYATIALTPFVLLFFVLGEPILVMLFGEAYRLSAAALAILVWGLFPFLANSILGNILLAKDRQWAAAKIGSFGILLNAVLNYVLIRTMGYQGAALATVIALFVCSLIAMYYLKRALFNVRMLSDFWLLFLPAAAGALVSILGYWEGFWMRLIVAFLVAGLLMWILRVFTLDELIWLRENLWPKAKNKDGFETMTTQKN